MLDRMKNRGGKMKGKTGLLLLAALALGVAATKKGRKTVSETVDKVATKLMS